MFGLVEKVTYMKDESAHEEFGFLTPDRIRVFKQSLESSNVDYDDILDGREYLHERLNPYHKGTGRRPSFVAHIFESMSDDEGVIEFDKWNMQGLVFDRKFACRFNKVAKKLDSSLIGEPRVIRESEQYRKAKELPSQPNLFLEDETGSEIPPPLADMVLIDVGYYARYDQIEELYFFMHDDDGIIQAMMIISLYDAQYATITDQGDVARPKLGLRFTEEEEDIS